MENSWRTLVAKVEASKLDQGSKALFFHLNSFKVAQNVSVRFKYRRGRLSGLFDDARRMKWTYRLLIEEVSLRTLQTSCRSHRPE